MDNLKTGNLIKEARKEKSLTQKDLAKKLHITDRAVSKWERGICAPDIALLEPLAEILELSVTELIAGERTPHSDAAEDAPAPETETAVREAIGYSRAEMRQKRKTSRKRVLYAALAAVTVTAICAFALWCKGYFHIIGRYPSPDGSTVTTVYDCYLANGSPPETGSFTLSDEGWFRGRTTYANLAFCGCWWSPDGSYQVVSAYSDSKLWSDKNETILFLTDYTRNVSSNLDIDLDRAVYNNAFFANVPDGTKKHEIEFEFIQWSQVDPAKMLVYFSYTDTAGQFREGYMWYDYESGKSYGEMEIEQGEKDPDPLHSLLISPFPH